VNKKRAAAAVDASAPVLGADDPEAARFASRVALHLREAALASGAAWDDARVRGAFEETVTNMPEGALRATLARNLAHFSEMIVEKTTRPVPADLPQLGELGGLDHEEFFALRERPRFDFDEMTLGELVHETRRCMLRATFDLPCWLADERDERDELEAVREQSLERCADVAAAMVGRFADEVAAAVGAGGTGKSGRGKGVEVPSAAVIEEVSETLARAQAYAALRRHSGGEDWSRERTHRAAARFPILRQALRRALSRDTKPARDKRATAGHDAAICCGHTRYFLVVALAKEVPDDVEVFASAVDGDAEGETDHAGGLHGKVKKKKSKRGVVGMFGVADLPLFEAALGLAGFDEDFEAKITKDGGGDFARLDAPAVDGAAGPALLPPFFPDAALAAADTAAFAPDATLTEIAASYEKALTGGSDWNFNDGESDGDQSPDPAATAEAEEMEYIAAYMALLKVLRGAAALCVAGGNRRRAENLARFAARAPCPALLLMHLPGRAAAADPRAASVELAAASAQLWAGALRAWAQVREMLSDVAPGRGDADDDAGGPLGSFFMDTTGDVDVDRAADLAKHLSLGTAGAGLGEDGELSKEEEEDLIDMLRRNKSWLGGAGDDDDHGDVLDNLSDEEGNLPEEASAAAAAVAAATAAAKTPKGKGKTPKKR